ncbi:WD40 repeat domain-containing serine/threonine-protein kinase [Nonomuraea turcica]|uniref:WD40 repeat domain-containing serine/threonine-protein kinase n=1 Tax=Nonomuraea sp. G32 TaxID=3067274 RepID=UPI00273C0AF4|nr:WD40 repeat domain-containing serine/threonine-protein kinase [Nonomuraea sp. G32]MDP4506155.1 WD40 repeat domain-containing serine/threonine-protein kinase [Nonomuraea sp. G32]
MLSEDDPQRLGDYWLAGRLGAGGQGVVYEAYAEDGRRVAIKVLHRGQAAQLAREVTAAQRVAAFCTARVIEARLEEARPYIVSEYVEGPSLRGAVAEGRRFTGGDLHRLGAAVATALTAIHDADVIHRDLKPDNVLLGSDGPRVIDFGVARTAEMSLTSTGLVTGTPTYMAPEVFTGQRAGKPADVFAWGAIMLYAATGKDPFEAESLGGVMHRVLSAVPDLSVLPEALRPLVAATLSKEPLHRPTARELLLSLVSGHTGTDTAHLLAEGGREAAGVTAATADPALGTLAEEAYEHLGQEERELAPEVFLRLVTVGERGELSARRAALAELVDGRPLPEVSAVTRILEVFAYLLGRDGEQVWLTRPALPHAWPRYRRWVDANRDGLSVHREILAAARRWERAGRRDGDLFHGHSLENALQWAATARRNITLSPFERDFLAAGARMRARRARRDRLVTLSLGGLLVIALVAAGLAVYQGGLADERAAHIAAQRDQAEAARLAQLAGTLRHSDPRMAMQLSVASWRLHRTPQTRAALTASLAQREVASFRDPATAAETLRMLSLDGRTLASVGEDAIRLWDVPTGRRTGGIARLGIAGEPLVSAALSPSKRYVVVATAARADVWDLRTGKVTRSWAYGKKSTPMFFAYGTVDRYVLAWDGEDNHVWDLERGTRVRTKATLGAMTPSGEAIYAMDTPGRIDLLRLPDLARRSTRPAAERCDACGLPLALTPDGRSLLERVRRGLQETSLKDGASWQIGSDGTSWNEGELTFSRDGLLLASVTRTGIQVWRRHSTFLTALSLPGGADDDAQPVPQAAFDGHTLRYLNEDRVVTVDLADLTGERPEPGGIGWSLTALVPGRVLATGDLYAIHLTTPGKPSGKPVQRRPDADGAGALALSPDGRLAAVGGSSTITVLDTSTRRELARWPIGEFSNTTLLAFSPDGTRLAGVLEAADLDEETTYTLRAWDWRARRPLWSAHVDEIRDMVFSPDGTTLAAASDAQQLFDAASGTRRGGAFGGTGQGTTITGVMFTRDGGKVAAVDSRGRVTVYDVATHRQSGEPIRGRLGGRGAVAARSPREDVAAVTTQDGRVQLFDLAAGADLGVLRDGAVEGPMALAFSADGSKVVELDGSGMVREQLVGPGHVAAAVCARAGVPLSGAEWKRYVTGAPYLKVCP